MSEPQVRSSGPRGRGSGRGGRGGYSTRGGRPRPAADSKTDSALAPSYEDEGEIGQLKKQYAPKLNTIREMFPDWTDEDLVFALQENDGDLEATIERISEGNVAQWGEVKKKGKDRGRSKAKDAANDGPDIATTAPRAGRGRGSEASRGRARGAERGRGAGRGRSGAVVNGAKKPAVESTTQQAPVGEENVSWAGVAEESANRTGSTSPGAGSWEVVTPSEAAPPAPDTQKSSSKPDGTRSWASMLKPAPKPAAPPVKPRAAPPSAVEPPGSKKKPVPAVGDQEIGKPPKKQPPAEVKENPPIIPQSEPAANLTPSKDELTETNLEQVQDVSNPIASETVASNAGTGEVRSAVGSLTSLNAQQQSNNRPSMGGYATTALKATTASSRNASFQRRVKDQQEAVVMPGHHAVDRTAVQFGTLGLGSQDDVDGEREDAETRTQPPQHSPVAPRASLPLAAQQAAADSIATGTRPAPGLPPLASQIQQADPTGATSQTAGVNYGYNQFNSIYGGGAAHHEASIGQPKPFDNLGQQTATGAGNAFENYPPHTQGAAQPGAQQGAFSSAASEYPSYYSSENQRNAYQNYYGAYGQQSQPGTQEHFTAQQKPGSGFMGSNSEAQPGANAASQPAGQGRFPTVNDTQPSGHSTQNPAVGHQGGQGPQSHQIGHGHSQAGGHGGYPYGGNPYYNHPYYSSSYVNQVGHHQFGPERPPYDDVRRYEEYYGQGNQYNYAGRHNTYSTGPYGSSKYGQPHASYGMSAQSQYDAHSASPANTGAYGQPQSVPGRDSSSGLSAYARTGSTQPTESQSLGTSAFGGMSDVFNRSQSGFSAQTSQPQSGPPGASEEGARGFGDSSKIPGGPSPAPGQGGVRPGSAANLPGQQNIPTSQSQAYGGYPSQMGQIHGQQSQYGTGLGGLGGHHQQGGGHQSSAYGGYTGFGGNYYNTSSTNNNTNNSSSNSRGGWTGNYGH